MNDAFARAESDLGLLNGGGLRRFVSKPFTTSELLAAITDARQTPPDLVPLVRQTVGLRRLHDVEDERLRGGGAAVVGDVDDRAGCGGCGGRAAENGCARDDECRGSGEQP